MSEKDKDDRSLTLAEQTVSDRTNEMMGEDNDAGDQDPDDEKSFQVELMEAQEYAHEHFKGMKLCERAIAVMAEPLFDVIEAAVELNLALEKTLKKSERDVLCATILLENTDIEDQSVLKVFGLTVYELRAQVKQILDLPAEANAEAIATSSLAVRRIMGGVFLGELVTSALDDIEEEADEGKIDIVNELGRVIAQKSPLFDREINESLSAKFNEIALEFGGEVFTALDNQGHVRVIETPCQITPEGLQKPKLLN